MDLRYRLRQFRELLIARPLGANQWEEIEAILSVEEVFLFRRFSPADRQHSYRVMATLRRAGHQERALLAAALLHDVGKTCQPLRLWERIAGALAELLAPGLVARWGRGSARGWQRPFVIRAQHGQWGAEMAAAANSNPTAVALIRHHQDKPPATGNGELDTMLRHLQWADDQH